MGDRVFEILVLFFINVLFVIAVIDWIKVDVVLAEEIESIQWETLAAGGMGLLGGLFAFGAARAPHLRAVKQNSINFVISHYEDIWAIDEFFDLFLHLVRDEGTIYKGSDGRSRRHVEAMSIADIVERLDRFSGQISELEKKLAIKILPVSQIYLRMDMLKNEGDTFKHHWQDWPASNLVIEYKKGRTNYASIYIIDAVTMLIELAPKVKSLRNVCDEYLSPK